jgi:hypothetical protein
LAFDRLQNGPPGSAARFAVIVEAIVLADTISPAVVRSGGIAHFVHESHSQRRRRHRRRMGEEAALPDLLTMSAAIGQRVQRFSQGANIFARANAFIAPRVGLEGLIGLTVAVACCLPDALPDTR